MKRLNKYVVIAAFVMPFFIYCLQANEVSASPVGNNIRFNVDGGYDEFGRTSISASVKKVSEKAYFFVDDTYWDSLPEYSRQNALMKLDSIASEFDTNIYPKLTAFLGSEPNPGVDNDPRLTILFEDLVKDNGGYFYSANLYPKSMASDSNEREMIVVSVTALQDDYVKTFIAHEFQHLISFTNKELTHGVSEETWLSELRSEFVPKVLGYDSEPQSGLQRRIRSFTEKSSDSLTLWPNTQYDYAMVSLFGRYLADHYGQEILSATLKMSSVGIDSINEYFRTKGINETFSSVFQKWTIANFYNNTFQDQAYRYLDLNLRNVRVTPQENFISQNFGEVSFTYQSEEWQPAWYRYYVQLDSTNSIQLNFNNGDFKIVYFDNLGRTGVMGGGAYITNPGGLNYFLLMPIYEKKGQANVTIVLKNIVGTQEMKFMSNIVDGTLIKRPNEPEVYVVTGKYKRYLSPEVVKLYGHLDINKAVAVSGNVFDSYPTANYVKSINDKKVYSVWPDNTKHWLNMTGEYFTASGRDWGSIFTINDSELNYYKLGAQITK